MNALDWGHYPELAAAIIETADGVGEHVDQVLRDTLDFAKRELELALGEDRSNVATCAAELVLERLMEECWGDAPAPRSRDPRHTQARSETWHFYWAEGLSGAHPLRCNNDADLSARFRVASELTGAGMGSVFNSFEESLIHKRRLLWRDRGARNIEPLSEQESGWVAFEVDKVIRRCLNRRNATGADWSGELSLPAIDRRKVPGGQPGSSLRVHTRGRPQ